MKTGGDSNMRSIYNQNISGCGNMRSALSSTGLHLLVAADRRSAAVQDPYLLDLRTGLIYRSKLFCKLLTVAFLS